MFNEKGIKYFDYSGLMSLANTMLPFDNAHPAPQLYEKVAQQLSQDIQALH